MNGGTSESAHIAAHISRVTPGGGTFSSSEFTVAPLRPNGIYAMEISRYPVVRGISEKYKIAREVGLGRYAFQQATNVRFCSSV